MKAIIDLDVMLDFLQRREPFFEDAACVMDAVLYGRVRGVLAAHAVTTLHYFLTRGAEKCRTEEVIGWLLEVFDVAPCTKEVLLAAGGLDMADYEDAVTAVCAQRAACSHIVTRNLSDFPH